MPLIAGSARPMKNLATRPSPTRYGEGSASEPRGAHWQEKHHDLEQRHPVALVGVVFVAIALVMDLAHLGSTVARAVFFGFMMLALGAAARGPQRAQKGDSDATSPTRPHDH